jgi:hypothetical protein
MPITYNPESCTFQIAGAAIAGWDSLEVSPATERWNLESSTDGLTSHRKDPHRGGTFTLTLSEESWENQVLPLIRGNIDNEFTISAVDSSGTSDSCVGESCHIVQQPTFRRGKEKVTVEVRGTIGILHFKATA